MPTGEPIVIPLIYTEDVSGLARAAAASQTVREETAKLQQQIHQANEQALSDTAIQMQAVKQAVAVLGQVSSLEAKIARSKKGSYDELSASYELVRLRLRQMTAEEIKFTKEGKELTAQAQKITKELKNFEKASGGAGSATGEFLDNLESMPGALGAAGTGVRSLSQGFKALLANPVVLVVSLIVAGLYALFNAFKSSEKGAQLMTKITGVMNGLFSFTVKIVDTLVTSIESFAKDPVAAIKDLGQAILDNIINRFKAVINIFGAAGKAIESLVTGNFEGLKVAAEDAKTAVIQFSTGLDEQQQEDFGNAIKEVTEEILKQTAAFVKLEEARRAIANSNRELARSAEKLRTTEELNRAIAADITKSFAEREEAAEKSRQAIEKRALREIQIARNNLAIITQELNLRRANGEEVDSLLDQQLSAYQAFAGAERQYTLAVRDNEKQRTELKQERLKNDLEILGDSFKNQRAINEKIIKDDEQAFGQRKALFEETRKLSDETFEKLIETVQQFTGVQIDGNELVAESDAAALNQKIRSLGLSEIIERKLLEIIKERRNALQDLAETETELGISRAKEAAEELKRQNELRALMNELELKEFEERQALAQSEFDLIRRTEQEKAAFQLQAERDKLQKILDLNREFNNGMSEEQIKTTENLIKDIDKQLEKVPNIFEKAKSAIIKALDISEEEFEQLTADISNSVTDAVNNTFAAFQYLIDAQISQQDAIIAKRQESVDALQEQLDKELELQEQGFANNSDLLKQKLEGETELLKQEEEKRLALEKKAAQLRLRQEALQTASNIALSVAKVISAESSKGLLGIVTAVAAVASIFALIAKAKAQAAQFAKPEKLRKGARLEGASHEHGGVPVVVNGERVYEAEGGEWLIGSKPSKEHNPFLNRLNSDEFSGLDLNKHIDFARAFNADPPGMITDLAPKYGIPVLPDVIGGMLPGIRKSVEKGIAAKTAAEQALLAGALADYLGRVEGGMSRVEKAIREKPERVPITEEGYIEFQEIGNKKSINIYRPPKRKSKP